MHKILITGGTGLIGKHLCKLLESDYQLLVSTRNPEKYTSTNKITYIYWDGKSLIPDILDEVDAIINLLGENIGLKRWTDKQKQRILLSRTNAAESIQKSLMLSKNKPAVWIQASATGRYGQSTQITFDENSPNNSSDFLTNVCRQWEAPINQFNDPEVRKIIIRTGVVIAHDSEFWKQLLKSFKFNRCFIPGNGKNIIPWIHISDEIQAIKFLLENIECKGIYNLTTNSITTMERIIELASSKNVKKVHIPNFFIELLFGKQMAEELVLTNQQVLPSRLSAQNYKFLYPNIEEAIVNIRSHYT